MELYTFHRLVLNFLSFGTKNVEFVLIASAIIGVVLWLGVFVLQGFGLLAMAKKQNLEKSWMAFVPFVNILYMGKIAGDCKIFGQKVKNVGVIAMIAQILATLATIAFLAAEMYLYLEVGNPQLDAMGMPYWTGLTGFEGVVSVVYDYGVYFLSIIQLVCGILLYIIVAEICKRYAYKAHFILSFLVLFVPISRFIILFVIRNNEPFDYEEMLRRRQNFYAQQQQYNPYNSYNPYNNPYNNPHGPYGYYGNGQQAQQPNQQSQQPQQNQQQPTPPEDPFEEFASTKKPNGHTEKNSNDADEFFN